MMDLGLLPLTPEEFIAAKEMLEFRDIFLREVMIAVTRNVDSTFTTDANIYDGGILRA